MKKKKLKSQIWNNSISEEDYNWGKLKDYAKLKGQDFDKLVSDACKVVEQIKLPIRSDPELDLGSGGHMDENISVAETFNFALTEELLKACVEKEVDPNKFLPHRADDRASGWDVRCADPNGVVLQSGDYIKVPLGFRTFCPKGWWLELNPRSSTFIKKRIHSLYGKIDESYEGQMMFCGQYLPDRKDIITSSSFPKIEFGDRIAQIMPVKLEVMSIGRVSNKEYDLMCKNRNAARGAGGFGSTGSGL